MLGRSVTLEWSRSVPERYCNKKWTHSENCYEQRENTDTLGWKDLFLLIVLRCWCLENRFWIVDLLPFLLDDLNLLKQGWRCRKEAGVITCWESHLYILLNAVLCWEKWTVAFAHIWKGRITATSAYLNTAWKHNGCHRRQTHQVFPIWVFTVILWRERNCICLINWQGSQSMLGTSLGKNLYSGVSSAAVNPTRLLLLSLEAF